MQACPCTRVRLLWQCQRNWHPPRSFSTAPGARNLSQVAESSAHSDDPALDRYIPGNPEKSAPELLDEQPNKASNSEQGGAIWSNYDELWGAAAAAVEGVENGVQALRQESSSIAENREPIRRSEPGRRPSRPSPVRDTKSTATTHLRHPQSKKRWTKRKSQELLNAHGFFRRAVSPEDYLRANAAFWLWKKQLSETWQMLESSQLPRAESESNMLRWLLEHKDGGKSMHKLRETWSKLSPERRRDLWPSIMVSALRSHPGRAHIIFSATFDAAHIPYYAVQDTIHHFCRQLAEKPSTDGSMHPTADEVYELLKMVLENSSSNYLRLRQSTIFFLVKATKTTESVDNLYHLLVKHGHPLHKFTRLQMASRVARNAAFKMPTVEMLQAALSATDLDINTPQGAALCTTILSVEGSEGTATTDGQPSLTPAEMFEQLLRCGLEPNLITYTTIIRGLCLKGELEAAQQVLQLMINNQTEPDEYVYSTMMNGAKLRGDFSVLRRVAETAAAQRINHPIVWNDFIQSIYSTAFAEARANPAIKRPRVVPSFPLMLQTYSKIFALEPLRTILPDAGSGGGLTSSHAQGRQTDALHGRWEFAAQLGPTVHALPKLEPGEIVEPTSLTLTTMILGYIQGVSNPYDVIAFYSHFRRLLQAGDPVATGLVRDQGTLVHDVVVMALCEYEGMLRVALDVVGDMLRDAATDLQHGDSEAADYQPQHPPPSVYTWSILLNGFMFHRQVRQGERILHMMRDRGVEPNQVTWNTLMAGYARLQNVKKTAVTLQRLERAGFEPDDFTFRAFSYLGDKSAILRYMETRKTAAAAASSGPKSKIAGQQYDQMAEEERQAQAGTPSPPHASSSERGLGLGHGVESQSGRRPADAVTNELRMLENEVEEIAKMMDEEQRDSATASF
ncbi:pentatricopeptide repeat protein [Grosmannia clavigera kw1407]|uniref:Pentatricopeptide repeat protein n=1 Tax=Grosmannia clavigera (strain kw1407 / UAMH 11150) TaxID=655863 RepID=F0XSM1_GROCL|nr:pentatricopeptide repeat protein [Grosmannia clavigera kw1407]EFW99136.1 pentatricopeptide repeat protein [Grosmannia clavigera kw1407]